MTRLVPLRRATSMTYGDALAGDMRVDGSVPVMSSGGITGRHNGANTGGPCVVIGRKGSHGSVWWSDVPAFVIDTAYSIDSANTSNELRWLYYVLQAVGLRDVSNDVGVPGLSRESAYEALVQAPPSLEVQRRIADFLDDQVARIDSIIARRKRQLDLLKTEFSAVLHSGISGSSDGAARRNSSLTWIDSLPGEWGEPRICQVARMGTGHTPSRSRPKFWQDCTIPWLTTAEVHRFRSDEIETISDTSIMISDLGLANSSAVLHPAGTVALSRTASAGFSIVMGVDMATSQDFATWTCGPLLRPDFLLWCLRDMRQDIMGRLATGSTHKTIYFPDLMSICIPLPPIHEQDAAVAQIKASHTRQLGAAAAMKALTERLEELKRSLITAAVSGEFDVSVADGSQVPISVPAGTSAPTSLADSAAATSASPAATPSALSPAISTEPVEAGAVRVR